MTTADLERLANDTPCSDVRKGALVWAAGRIRELEAALTCAVESDPPSVDNLPCVRCGSKHSERWAVCLSNDGKVMQTFCLKCHREGLAGGFSYIGDPVYAQGGAQ